jgi:Mlc titration factor MtfA (ptsG expression regulator)
LFRAIPDVFHEGKEMDWNTLLAVTIPALLTLGVIIFVLRKAPENSVMLDFPLQWIELLNDNCALYRLIPEVNKPELHNLINRFIREKSFEGCAGLAITDRMRLIVAFHAALLLLNKPFDCYPLLHSVLLYPTAFNAEDIEPCGSQCVRGGYSEKIGESWQHGDVILAWDAVREESRRIRLGCNSIIHEFAHQLDQSNGAADGIPIISDRTAGLQWQKTIQSELKKLRRETAAGIQDVIDEYGTLDEAEFFAVASETFFCMPVAMGQQHPKLYRALRNFYQLDPRQWHKSAQTRPLTAVRRSKPPLKIKKGQMS